MKDLFPWYCCIPSKSFLFWTRLPKYRPSSSHHHIRKWDSTKSAFQQKHSPCPEPNISECRFLSWHLRQHTLRSPYRLRPWFWARPQSARWPHQVVYRHGCWPKSHRSILWLSWRLHDVEHPWERSWAWWCYGFFRLFPRSGPSLYFWGKIFFNGPYFRCPCWFLRESGT